MKLNPHPNISSLLDAAFRQEEIHYLSAQREFRAAWARTITADDFERLRVVAEKLLQNRLTSNQDVPRTANANSMV